ncbi:hypothetical protein Tco_0432359 [Tanacetum coccineum]
MIKSHCIAFKLFIVMQLWDKCYINFKKINEITFQTTHLEVVLLYLVLLYYEVTPPDIFPLRHIFEGVIVQARVEADYHLAQRLQAQEQEELTDEEKARLFVQFLEQRRKHFAAKRVEEKRNRPPTRAQQRSFMCTYLKNMEGWKPKDLKNKSFANIQELFDKAMKRVNTFVDMDAELVEGSEVRAEGSETRVEGSSKRVGEELEQESSKKQKLEDDKETAELQRLIEVVPDNVVAIDCYSFVTQASKLVTGRFIKEGRKVLFI